MLSLIVSIILKMKTALQWFTSIPLSNIANDLSLMSICCSSCDSAEAELPKAATYIWKSSKIDCH